MRERQWVRRETEGGIVEGRKRETDRSAEGGHSRENTGKQTERRFPKINI